MPVIDDVMLTKHLGPARDWLLAPDKLTGNTGIPGQAGASSIWCTVRDLFTNTQHELPQIERSED